MAQETFTFQAEVSKLLDIVAHSLYSHKEIFLRELVSNASDACDKLRYLALTEPGLVEDGSDFRIEISVDRDAKTLSIADNGIGMNHDELSENLGTIAKSGTRAFFDHLTGDARKDMALIGQFGVGFYSAFMVATEVEALSRRAGEAAAWRWRSDGKGRYTIEEAERASRGTTVLVHLQGDELEYLDEHRIRHIVTRYADHVAIPIVLKKAGGDETLNRASALWTRPKAEITAEQYTEFYHHVGHTFDDPWLTLHNSVEGVLSYTNLLFVPSQPPFDLFHPDRKNHVKLYVKRVFITDDAEGLLPGYLRFLRGVVDSEDLPLNISREMFQKDPKLARIKSGLTRKVLTELKKKAGDAPAEYAAFWDHFGAVLKEGLYEDAANRDTLLEVTRFRSTAGDDLVDLATYVGRMREGQDAIFYITGDDLDALRQSPQLEGFKARGVEVLFLTDPVDEFWVPSVGRFQDKEFKSVTRAGVELGRIKGDDKPAGDAASGDKKDGADTDTPAEAPADVDALIAAFKVALGEAVKDVRSSERLTESAVCLVADDDQMDMHIERLLRKHKQLSGEVSKRILEVNPRHPLIRTLAGRSGDGATMEDAAFLLYDQARIVEGETIDDAAAFARRLTAMMAKGLAG